MKHAVNAGRASRVLTRGAALFAFAVLAALPALAGGKTDSGTAGGTAAAADKVVVVGSQEFNGIFNSVLYHSNYDGNIAGLVELWSYKQTRDNSLESFACEYQPPVEYQENGKTYVKYTYKLLEGLVFSDGKPVTADDMIFTWKLYFDPSYDGLATMFTVNVLGGMEYRYDDPNYSTALAAVRAAAEKRWDPSTLTLADFIVYAEATALAGWWTGNPAGDIGDGRTWSKYAQDEGFGADLAAINASDAKAMFNLIAKIEYTNYLSAYDVLSWGVSQAEADYAKGNLADGEQVTEISGIRKIDNRTVEIIVEGIDPTAEKKLAIDILPKHYYGVGYKKGDLSSVRKLNSKPLGGGPYTFVSYENNIVTLKANPLFFKGEPKIKTLKFQVTDNENLLPALKLGEIDIGDPSASPETVAEAEAAGLHVELIDNNGYGYIGVNADRIPDKNVRKALMHLMNRKPAVDSYYGELADIIERPLSKVDWAYPQGATEYYGYSVAKAEEYFKAAGYAKDASGKLVKNGQQFYVELWLSSATHPVVPLFTQMKIDLEKLGARCDIQTTEWSIYNEKYQKGELDIWAAAWGGGSDPDMYQIYHSSQVATGNNPYHIKSAALDQLIQDGRSTTDRAKRAEIYARAYDIVMDEAVEMPFYQRKNMYAIRPNIVDISTLPENMTPYYEWDAEIWTLQAK